MKKLTIKEYQKIKRLTLAQTAERFNRTVDPIVVLKRNGAFIFECENEAVLAPEKNIYQRGKK